jgi:hypothetical protein
MTRLSRRSARTGTGQRLYYFPSRVHHGRFCWAWQDLKKDYDMLRPWPEAVLWMGVFLGITYLYWTK